MKITKENFKKFELKYEEGKFNKAIENSIANVGILESCLNNEVLRKHNFVFSDTIELAKITNQKQSGRCWMFASYNVDRLKVMKKLNLETFEFSENYLFFFDKMEKANNFLVNIINNKKENLDSRLMEYLLSLTVEDGGYWDNFAQLVRKYGSVPKECMPETYHSSNSKAFLYVMDQRLKKAAKDILKAKTKKEMLEIKEQALEKIYDICVKALGKPPKKITYKYYDKDKKYNVIETTPLKFYEDYVGFDSLDKVQLADDPRGKYSHGDLLEVKYFKSVVEDKGVRLLIVPFEELKKATIKSIKDGTPVWFAADVSHMFERTKGIIDENLYSFDETLNELGEFTKADRMDMNFSRANHAMAFVGVDLDEKGNPISWKVENSWGDKNGKDGIYSMSDKWFDEYNYLVIVDKKYVSKEWLDKLDQEPKEIELWDPVSKMTYMK